MQLLTRTFLDDIENDDAKSSHAQGATQHNEQNNETESIRKEGRGEEIGEKKLESVLTKSCLCRLVSILCSSNQRS